MGFTKRTPTQRAHDRERRAATRIRMRNQLRTEALSESLLHLGACDGALTQPEISFLSRHIPGTSERTSGQNPRARHAIQPEQMRRAMRAWIAAASPAVSERKRVLRALHDFALCDGPLSPEEELVLGEISTLLRLTMNGRMVRAQRRHDSTRARGDEGKREDSSKRTKSSTDEPAIPWCYEILGCSPSDTDEEIKRRYRQLALKLHPDKHSMQPETAASQARAFQRVSQAYAEIKKLRERK